MSVLYYEEIVRKKLFLAPLIAQIISSNAFLKIDKEATCVSNRERSPLYVLCEILSVLFIVDFPVEIIEKGIPFSIVEINPLVLEGEGYR